MNYYNPGKRSLITDVLSPWDKDGLNTDHLKVQKEPIGLLNKRYQRRYAYKNKAQQHAKQTEPATYTMVPPLVTLRRDHRSFNPITKARALLGMAALAILGFKKKTAQAAGRLYNPGIKYRAIVPLLILLVGLIWLLHTHPKPAGVGTSTIEDLGQTIPVVTNSNPGAINNGSNNSSNNNSASPNAPLAGTSSAGAQNAASAQDTFTGSGTSGGSTTLTGGMGGGGTGSGTTSGTGTTTGSSSGSGLLPLTVAVPPTDTSLGDKTLLDTSGTTITVN